MMLKSVGARIHPCFTPLLIWNWSEGDLLHWTVPVVRWPSSWAWGDIWFWAVGWRGPGWLTTSNALVRSMRVRNKGHLCSQHLSYSCVRENTMLIVDRFAWNTHWVSGYTLSASSWRWRSTPRAKALSTRLRRQAAKVGAIAAIALVLVEHDTLCVPHVLGFCDLFTQAALSSCLHNLCLELFHRLASP